MNIIFTPDYKEYELYEKYPVSIGKRLVTPYYKGVLKMTPKDKFTILVRNKSVARIMCIIYMDNVKIGKCPLAPDMPSNLYSKYPSKKTLGYPFFKVKNPETKRHNFNFTKEIVDLKFYFYYEELNKDIIGFLEVCKDSKNLDGNVLEKINDIYSNPIIFDPDNKESFDIKLISKYLKQEK